MSIQCYDGKIVEGPLPAAGEAEMPPFPRIVLEAMAGEQVDQHPSCFPYFGRELRSCRMRHRIEAVECGSHIETGIGLTLRNGAFARYRLRSWSGRLGGFLVSNRQIDGIAAIVLGGSFDVAQPNKVASRYVRMMVASLATLFGKNPRSETTYSRYRSIAIEDLQRKVGADCHQLPLRASKRLRHPTRQNAFVGVIAWDGCAREIEPCRISHVLHDRTIDGAQVDQAGRQLLGSVAGRNQR